MRRKETRDKLDVYARGESRRLAMTLTFVLLAAFAAILIGYNPGADQGEHTATVRWSGMERSWKSVEPHSRISAVLDDGREIYATSPHTPQPVPGDRIVLHVRRNILGW